MYTLNLGPFRVPLKNHQNSSLSPGPQKNRKSDPRVTKRDQNVSQIPPAGHQISEVSKVGPQGLPKWSLNSTKIETWTSRCLFGVPVDPWITKMITQGTKMESQGLQNVSFGVKK